MSATTFPESSTATRVGLFIALFAMPLVLLGFQFHGVASTEMWVIKEACIFALLFLLLALVVGWERLPLSSISPGTRSLTSSIVVAVIGLVASAAGVVFCLWLLPQLGLQLGGGGEATFEPPIWALTLTLARAGIVEEVFYRGYAIERLTVVTGSRTLAAFIALVLFSLFHYRQGPAGIVVAFVLGFILTVMYLVRRDVVANSLTHFTGDFILNVVPFVAD